MENQNARRTIYRFLAIALLLGIVAAMFAVTAVLASLVKPQLSTGSIVILSALAITTLASSILANTIPQMVKIAWRWPQTAGVDLVAVVDWLRRLRRPGRLIGIGLVAVLVIGAGLLLRPPPSNDVLEPGSLKIMTAFDDSPNDPRSMIREQWNQLHPENPASFEFAPGEPDEQNERMVKDAEQGGDQQADIYLLDIVWLQQFIHHKYIRQLDRASLPDLRDYQPKVMNAAKRNNDEVWAMPLNADIGLVYYRTGVQGVGIPEKWDDYFGPVAESAVQSAQKAGLDIEAANAAQLAGQEMLTVTALEAIWAADGKVVTAEGQVIRTTDKREVRFDTSDKNGIKNLAKAAYDPRVVLKSEENGWVSTERDATEAFASGRTLYMRNWPVEYEQIKQINKDLDFDVTAPRNPSVLGGQYLAISANTKKFRAAQALIEFFTSASSQLILSEVGGFVPSHEFALKNTRRPYGEALREALDKARLRPVTACYTEFSKKFRDGIAVALSMEGRLPDDFPRQLATILECDQKEPGA